MVIRHARHSTPLSRSCITLELALCLCCDFLTRAANCLALLLLMTLAGQTSACMLAPPAEYTVAAERALQGLYLEMLEREDDSLDPRSDEAESALRRRYDEEVARLLAPTGHWLISDDDTTPDRFVAQGEGDEA